MTCHSYICEAEEQGHEPCVLCFTELFMYHAIVLGGGNLLYDMLCDSICFTIL